MADVLRDVPLNSVQVEALVRNSPVPIPLVRTTTLDADEIYRW